MFIPTFTNKLDSMVDWIYKKGTKHKAEIITKITDSQEPELSPERSPVSSVQINPPRPRSAVRLVWQFSFTEPETF
jgi:hypothetical protein